MPVIPVYFSTSGPLAGDVESGVKSYLKICFDQYCPEDTPICVRSYHLSDSSRIFCYSPCCEGSQESICAGNDVKHACIVFIKTRTGQVVV